MGTEIFYHHERLGRNAVTLALRLIGLPASPGMPETLSMALYAVSFCDAQDQFSREKGRSITALRLQSDIVVDKKGRRRSTRLRHGLSIPPELYMRLNEEHNRPALYDLIEVCMADALKLENSPHWFTQGWREKVKATENTKRIEKQVKATIKSVAAPAEFKIPEGLPPKGVPMGTLPLEAGISRDLCYDPHYYPYRR